MRVTRISPDVSHALVYLKEATLTHFIGFLKTILIPLQVTYLAMITNLQLRCTFALNDRFACDVTYFSRSQGSTRVALIITAVHRVV